MSKKVQKYLNIKNIPEQDFELIADFAYMLYIPNVDLKNFKDVSTSFINENCMNLIFKYIDNDNVEKSFVLEFDMFRCLKAYIINAQNKIEKQNFNLENMTSVWNLFLKDYIDDYQNKLIDFFLDNKHLWKSNLLRKLHITNAEVLNIEN